jgi:hypothetical protein
VTAHSNTPSPLAGEGWGEGASPLPLSANPDIAQVGPGPAGCRCGECGNLGAVRIDPPAAREAGTPSPLAGEGWGEGVASSDPASGRARGQTLYYCTLSGQAKRVTWPACANFVAVPDSRPLTPDPASEAS